MRKDNLNSYIKIVRFFSYYFVFFDDHFLFFYSSLFFTYYFVFFTNKFLYFYWPFNLSTGQKRNKQHVI